MRLMVTKSTSQRGFERELVDIIPSLLASYMPAMDHGQGQGMMQ